MYTGDKKIEEKQLQLDIIDAKNKLRVFAVFQDFFLILILKSYKKPFYFNINLKRYNILICYKNKSIIYSKKSL